MLLIIATFIGFYLGAFVISLPVFWWLARKQSSSQSFFSTLMHIYAAAAWRALLLSVTCTGLFYLFRAVVDIKNVISDVDAVLAAILAYLSVIIIVTILHRFFRPHQPVVRFCARIAVLTLFGIIQFIHPALQAWIVWAYLGW